MRFLIGCWTLVAFLSTQSIVVRTLAVAVTLAVVLKPSSSLVYWSETRFLTGVGCADRLTESDHLVGNGNLFGGDGSEADHGGAGHAGHTGHAAARAASGHSAGRAQRAK